MKKSIYMILGIIVIIIVAGIIIYNFKFRTRVDPDTGQICNIRGEYCYYINIPEGILYTQPEERIPKNLEASSEDKEKYFERIGTETKEIHEIFGIDPSKYKCKNTGKSPVIINYFYDTCEWAKGMEGCGYERKAVVCGNVYFVEQYADWTGPVMYGPFNLS